MISLAVAVPIVLLGLVLAFLAGRWSLAGSLPAARRAAVSEVAACAGAMPAVYPCVADGTGGAGTREAAKVTRSTMNAAIFRGSCTRLLVLRSHVNAVAAEQDPAVLRGRLVQLGAVAVAWLEDLERRGDAAPASAEPRDGPLSVRGSEVA